MSSAELLKPRRALIVQLRSLLTLKRKADKQRISFLDNAPKRFHTQLHNISETAAAAEAIQQFLEVLKSTEMEGALKSECS